MKTNKIKEEENIFPYKRIKSHINFKGKTNNAIVKSNLVNKGIMI